MKQSGLMKPLQHAYDAHKSRLEGKYAPVFGVKGYSWFMFVPGFDIIKGVAVDYMHCVLLGVTKMLMTLWFDKTHASEDWSISKRVEEVDRRLLHINPPNCISRAPRSIANDFAHWKASEFQSFLFSYGIPYLWNILPCVLSAFHVTCGSNLVVRPEFYFFSVLTESR